MVRTANLDRAEQLGTALALMVLIAMIKESVDKIETETLEQ